MCKCDPNKRTPWCGKPGCEIPEQDDQFKHLDIEKVAARYMGEWLRIARLQGQWTSAKALKRMAEDLGASEAMMKMFDVHIQMIEERLPTPSKGTTNSAADIGFVMTTNASDEISPCDSCNCLTYTIGDKCGKCGAAKTGADANVGLPEEIRERITREMEAIISQVVGQRTTLTDPRNKGIIRDFAERYSKRFDVFIEEADRKARIDTAQMAQGFIRDALAPESDQRKLTRIGAVDDILERFCDELQLSDNEIQNEKALLRYRGEK